MDYVKITPQEEELDRFCTIITKPSEELLQFKNEAELINKEIISSVYDDNAISENEQSIDKSSDEIDVSSESSYDSDSSEEIQKTKK